MGRPYWYHLHRNSPLMVPLLCNSVHSGITRCRGEQFGHYQAPQTRALFSVASHFADFVFNAARPTTCHTGSMRSMTMKTLPSATNRPAPLFTGDFAAFSLLLANFYFLPQLCCLC
jgi:hypothetical protein